MSAQFSFDWPAFDSHAAEDFLRSDANEGAAHFLAEWPGDNHSAAAALLSGPPASGKTHLARGWILRLGGVVIDPGALGKIASAALWGSARAALLEDVHAGPGEIALFHALRHAEIEGKFLLLTSRLPAPALPIALPDLRSRLMALPAPTIAEPDDALIEGFLLKRFADRQLRVEPAVIAYLVRRLERSFAAADAAARTIDRLASQTGRPVTIPLAKAALDPP